MSSQKLNLELKGLYTSPNNLSGTPPGALQRADNVVINAKNLVESRRGQTQYGDVLTIGSGQINKLFNYSSSLICSYDNKLAYDSGSGTWVTYSGTYSAPDADYKMRSLEASRNFYFTTSEGIKKLDAINATPRAAGVTRGLGGTATTTGTTGFLLADTAVAYRLVWGYVDENDNLILGAPSQRLVVANDSVNDVDVNLTFAIPSSITTEYFYQIYRSNASATAADQPSDELQLVIQGNPTSGEIAAKSFTVQDVTPYSLMRVTLYTSPSQQGIANANYQPPFALDMDIFKDCAFYANVKQKQTLSLALISVENPSLGYVVDPSVGTTNLSTTLSTIADTSLLRVGMRCVGTGIPANTTITQILTATTVQMSAAATATASVSVEFQDRFTLGGVNYWAGTAENIITNTFLVDVSGTPGQNIDATALSLIQVINTSTSNTTVYAYYLSALNDLPGQILFEERSIGGSAFAATSTIGASFSPALPTTGTTVSSTNEERQNVVMISKAGQPEAVPSYRFFPVGSANFPIQRVVALRDGIFFFKTDGVFRLSGETFESFTVSLVDSTVILQVPESAVAFNNQVFCFTTQGICAVTDTGVRIMSVPIEDELLELSSNQFTNFSSASFGVAYESARLYIFNTVTNEEDEVPTQAFVYNSLTDSWTRWTISRTCGIVNSAVNKLFMAQPDTGQVLVERKSFTNDDYADEQYAVTIVSVDSSTTITLADASLVVEGMTIGQGFVTSYIDSVDGDLITVTSTDGFIAGAAAVYTPIENFIEWSPIDCENPGILKQFSELSLFFKNAAFQEIEASFSSNISVASKVVPITNNSNFSVWGGFEWGSVPWGGALGGNAVLRTYIPQQKQRAHWLTLGLRTQEAFTGFSLQGVSLMFNPMSSRFK